MENIIKYSDQLGAISLFYFAPIQDVAEIPDAIDGVINDPVIFNIGKSFYTAFCRFESISYEETPTMGKDGIETLVSLKAFVPGDTDRLKILFAEMVHNKYVLLCSDSNNTKRLCGTLENPMRFKYKFELDKKVSGGQGYSIEFSVKSNVLPPFYNTQFETIEISEGNGMPVYYVIDENFIIQNIDFTAKRARFDCSNISIGNTRKIILPDGDLDMQIVLDFINAFTTPSIATIPGLQDALNDLQNQITIHENNYNNPHQTTLEQVRSADNFVSGEVDMNSNRLRNLPIPLNSDEAANKSYVDSLIDSTIKRSQAYTPSGTYPSTWFGQTIQAGDSFRLSAGSINSFNFQGEELLIANVDNPGQVDSNWHIIEGDRTQATESVLGLTKIASTSNVQDEYSTNNSDTVTPQKLWFGILRFIQLAWTWSEKQTFSISPKLTSVGASKYLKTDINSDVTGILSIPATDITAVTDKNFVTDAEKSYLAKQNYISNDVLPFKYVRVANGTMASGFDYTSIGISPNPRYIPIRVNEGIGATQEAYLECEFVIPKDFVSFPTNCIEIICKRTGSVSAFNVRIIRNSNNQLVTDTNISPTNTSVFETKTASITGSWTPGERFAFVIFIQNPANNTYVEVASATIFYNKI